MVIWPTITVCSMYNVCSFYEWIVIHWLKGMICDFVWPICEEVLCFMLRACNIKNCFLIEFTSCIMWCTENLKWYAGIKRGPCQETCTRLLFMKPIWYSFTFIIQLACIDRQEDIRSHGGDDLVWYQKNLQVGCSMISSPKWPPRVVLSSSWSVWIIGFACLVCLLLPSLLFV